MISLYGIECGRQVLYNELLNVLCFDGNYIFHSHPALLCDLMVHHGFLTPITRHGLKMMTVQPLMRASFEQTSAVFLNAAIRNKYDQVRGNSEKIFLGGNLNLGTGAVIIEEEEQEQEQERRKGGFEELSKSAFLGRRRRIQNQNSKSKNLNIFKINLYTKFKQFLLHTTRRAKRKSHNDKNENDNDSDEERVFKKKKKEVEVKSKSNGIEKKEVREVIPLLNKQFIYLSPKVKEKACFLHLTPQRVNR